MDQLKSNGNQPITDLKEQIFRNSIIDNIPAHIFWKDLDLIYLGCNTAFVHSLGLKSKDQIIGKSDFDLPVSKKNSTAFRLDDLDIINSGKSKLNIEEEQILKGGIKKFLSTSKVPLLDENGNIYGVLGVYIDITSRKKMETALLLAKEKAEIANQAKLDFISNMQHDLRTPFSGIGGMAQVLYAICKDNYPELMPYLEIMIKSCTQWENVHNRIFDVLCLEKITSVKTERVSIWKELEKIHDMMAATIGLKNLKWTIEPIPATLEFINTDSLKFHLILLSLISNAVNFTEKGEIKIIVSQEDNCRVIHVMDTGIGIASDKYDYIFEKFTKLSLSNQAGNDFKGVGLGLYAAKQYATQLGATIQVESKLGKGSTFSLVLSRA